MASRFTEDAVIYDTNHAPIISAENMGNFWVPFTLNGPAIGGGTHRGRRDLAAIEWRMDGEHQGNKFEVRGSDTIGSRSLIAEIRQYWTFDASSPGSGLIDYPYGDSNRLGSDDV